MICAENNFIIYQCDDGDERALLRQDGERIPVNMKDATTQQLGGNSCTILSVTANEDEDRIYAVTSSGQLITAALVLEDNSLNKADDLKFDFVLGPFHRAEISGIDVCVRKELIVTSSKDKSVSIWNYATKQHEISHVF